MTKLATIALLLALSACAPEVARNAVAAVENAVEAEAKPTPKPSPTPSPSPALPDNLTVATAAGANGLPADVQKFIERREGCEHFAGEPDYDDARRKQIADAVKELCPGIDRQLATLRTQHRDNPEAIAALADFEPLGMEP